MKPVLISITLLALAGCMQSSPPTVSERNSAGIRLQTGPGVSPPVALVGTQRMATSYCSSGGKSAIYADTRMLANGGAEHYYSCR